MKQPEHSPFRGSPRTRIKRDRKGNQKITVKVKALTPFRAIIRSLVTRTAAVLLITGGLYCTAQFGGQKAWHWVAALLGPLAFYPILYWGIGLLLRKRRLLVFTPERFSFRTLFGWKHFSRQHPHQFILVPHDRAQNEADWHEYWTRRAQLKGKAIKVKRYFGESYHLCFEYLGQRNDIMPIYKHELAVRIQSRLKAVDDAIESLSRRGNGVSLRPEDDWSEQSGDIPDQI